MAREPGESDVFTVGRFVSPLATALRASRPAASICLGLEVLVQDVMDVITMSPSARVPPLRAFTAPGCALRKLLGNADSGMRCSGRLGPATAGSTADRSKSITRP